LLAVVALLAVPAWASAVSTNCAGLQTTLTNASAGETIDLTELCTVSNSGVANGSFTLPTATGVTIEGAAAGDGFDGTGVTAGPALGGAAPSGLTLRNLTFENYSLSNNGAVTLRLPASGALPVIDHDSFLGNTNTGGVPAGGALDIFGVSTTCSYTGSLTINDSLFSGNQLTATITTNSANSGATGGGASIAFECTPPQTANLVITGNTFRQNSISTAGISALGGGLYAANGEAGPLTATQSGNVFESNSIVNTGTAATTFDGGGEWLASVNLTSTSDAYIGNSLPGPGTGSASEGAGLGAVRGNCPPPPTFAATAAATNLVAAGNSIGAPSGGDVEGAGVYAGCTATTGTQGFQLTLTDSTVSGNSGPGGAAGVDGESGDSLTLQNSIVAGNTGAGASDLGGFGVPDGANATAASSDVCAIGSTTTPFAGTGNICADPLLASPATGDVHETAASPTIDAGSNALVPSGVGTDFYGQPRIVGTKQAQGIVDIGAAEDQTAFIPPSPITPPSPPTAPPPAVHLTKLKATSSGVDVTIRCAGTASQQCSGRISLTTVETRLGRKVIAVASAAAGKPKRRHVTVAVGSARYRLAGGHSMTMHVKLNRVGRVLLARFHKLPVKVTLTQAGRSKPVATRKLKIKARRRTKRGH
jgi:hypothetical protein